MLTCMFRQLPILIVAVALVGTTLEITARQTAVLRSRVQQLETNQQAIQHEIRQAFRAIRQKQAYPMVAEDQPPVVLVEIQLAGTP